MLGKVLERLGRTGGWAPHAILRSAAARLKIGAARRGGRIGASPESPSQPSSAPGESFEALLHEALDILPQGIVFLDADGRYLLWNQSYANIYAGSSDLFAVGTRLEDTLRVGIARGHYPDAIGREEAWLAERMDRMHNPVDKFEQQLSDGRWILIDERRTSNGGTIGLRVDITDLKERERSTRLLFEDNPVPMFVVARDDGRILAVNAAVVTGYGRPRAQIVGSDFTTIAVGDGGGRDRRPDAEASASWSCRHRMAGDEIRDVTVFARPFVYENRAADLMAVFDVTDRNRAEARAAYLAHHDPLTGLANRVYLQVRLQDLLAERGEGLAPPTFAILMIDLDHFKMVNDTLGHFTGDHLLVEVARRIRVCLREGDFVARLGGDEFAVITQATSAAALDDLAGTLVEAMAAPCHVDGHDIPITASIGIALSPADGRDPEMVMRSADLALYRAKADGRGTYRFFEAAMDARLQARRALEMELRKALETNALTVHYQPLVDLASGSVDAFEALVRWNHPERGMIPPMDFIPLAEETNLIVRLGAFVLNRACHDAMDWPEHVKVAVNLSPLQFRSGALLVTVMDALKSSGLAAHRLELEVTEALLLERTEQVLATLHALRALGIRIAMDDFGTGYSSLSYLRSFPFDKIKIDRSFVRDMGASPDAAAIVKAIVNLGSSLGMKVTAEGIEDFAAAALLTGQGCTQGQGYYFSRPAPPADAAAMVADGGRRMITGVVR